MMTFRYKARDSRGELMTGLLKAASSAEAGSMLRGEGKFIVSIEESSDREAGGEAGKAKRRVAGRIKRDEVISFSHQLAAMVETGVPLSDALECAADQCENAAFAEVLRDVCEHVQGGAELSSALKKHPKVFPTVMTSLVGASELSGTMATMLDRISGYLAKEQQTAKKIKGALPKFTVIFAQRGAALPAPTKALMFLSDALLHHWYFWIGGGALLVGSFVLGKRTDRGRRLVDGVKLHCPVLGDLFRKLYITRAMRTMGTMIEAGVPILDMIATAREVTCNVWYEDLWDDLDDRLRQGGQLSDGMFESKLIPRPVAQMIYAGEKSGRLGKTMNKIAGFTEVEFDEQVKTTTSLIEPAMTAAMGGIIGFVAIAMLLPIFTVSNVVAS